jgi:hypothetical protein
MKSLHMRIRGTLSRHLRELIFAQITPEVNNDIRNNLPEAYQGNNVGYNYIIRIMQRKLKLENEKP